MKEKIIQFDAIRSYARTYISVIYFYSYRIEYILYTLIFKTNKTRVFNCRLFHFRFGSHAMEKIMESTINKKNNCLYVKINLIINLLNKLSFNGIF